jgi:signal transduction histidine kinase/ActR/RegA family two-component response regulator/PAS domain-containing protein
MESVLSATPPNPRLRQLAVVLAVYAVGGGAVSLLGWVADFRRLTDWIDNGISIQPNAAVAVIAAGLGLLCIVTERVWAGRFFATIVAAIGMLVLFEYLTGANLGIDTLLLFGRTWGRRGVLMPGRMGPPGAVSWTVIGIALMLASARGSSGQWRAGVAPLALCTTGIASLSIVGYLYGADVLFALPTVTVIALQTATFVLALSIGLIFSVPDHGPARLLGDPGPGGMVVRRIVPAAIVVPIVIGLVHLGGQRAGIYDLGFGSAARTIAEIVLMLWLLAWTAPAIARQALARRVAERAVEASEHRLRTIFESAAVSLWEVDISEVQSALQQLRDQGSVDIRAHLRTHLQLLPEVLRLVRVVEVNDTTLQMFRAANRTQLAERFSDLVVDAVPLFTEVIEALGKGRPYLQVEGTLSTLAGSRLYVHLTMVVLTAPNQVGRAIVSIVDLTARKESETALRQSRKELETDLANSTLLQQFSAAIVHENDLQALFDRVVAVAVALTRAEFASLQILERHPETGATGLRLIAHRGFGAEAAAFWQWVSPVSDSTCGHAMRQLERVIVPDVLTCSFMDDTDDLRAYEKAGIRAVQSTPLVSRSGELLGMMSTHWAQPTDPTARDMRLFDILARQVADLLERRQSEAALREADRRKDEFLVTLAHEMRNPLAPARSAVDLLKQSASLEPALIHAREVLDRQLSAMARLLDDLLDMARISRDRFELRIERVDARSAVEAAVESAGPMLAEFGQRLHFTVPDDPIYLDADPVRLAQILGNLLNNAGKYSLPGGQIWLTLERQGDAATITVKDSGIGIPQDRLSNIFDLFTQVDASLERSRGGLGIGLHLVKRLVQLHGGQVAADSPGLGMGSTFTILLPAATAQTESPEASPQLTVGSAVSRRILVVDDNSDAATMLATLLELSGHEVMVAFDAVQALEQAVSFHPDVIFLDIGLPKMNGFDVCRQLRARPGGDRPVVIALTGWGQEADRQRSKAAGFDHHIVKPLDHGKLLALLADLPTRSPAVANRPPT